MGAKLFIWGKNIVLNKKKLNLTVWNCSYMVSMATHGVILNNGVAPTLQIISQLLLNLDYQNWYQIKA